MSRWTGDLITGTILALVTASLLVLFNFVGVISSLTQVMVIVSGMTAMGALTAFQRFVEGNKGNAFVGVTFNEVFLSRSISEGFPKGEQLSAFLEGGLETTVKPWDLTPGLLVGIDNALALARVRMDIERELRRMAYDAKIDLRIPPPSVINLSRELVLKEVLPAGAFEALKEIVAVCNKGVHGLEVPNDVAAAVVRVGHQLLERLRSLPRLA